MCHYALDSLASVRSIIWQGTIEINLVARVKVKPPVLESVGSVPELWTLQELVGER